MVPVLSRLLYIATPALLWASSFEIQPARLPAATLGRAYPAGPLVATGGGMCPYNAVRLSVVGGMMPDGLTLAPNGYFSGAPATPGTFRFLVRASNGCSWSDQEYTLEVEGAPLLSVYPGSIEYRITAGEGVPGPVTIKVSNGTGSGPYSVRTTGGGWLQARARMGSTPGRESAFDSDIIDVYLDTANLPPGVHQAEIQVGAWRAAQTPVVPVTISVIPRPLTQEQMLRLQQVPHAPAPSHGAGDSAHAAPSSEHAAPAAPKPAAPKPAVRRYASRGRARPSPTAPKATASVDPHAKPSPLGDKVAHAAPAAKAESHDAKPAAAAPAHGAPAAKADAHGKPAEHGKTEPPKPDAHGKNEAKPKPDAHGKPEAPKADAKSHDAKPHDAKAKEEHGKSGGDGHGKSEAKPEAKPDAKAKPDQHAKADTKPKSGH